MWDEIIGNVKDATERRQEDAICVPNHDLRGKPTKKGKLLLSITSNHSRAGSQNEMKVGHLIKVTEHLKKNGLTMIQRLQNRELQKQCSEDS